MNKIKKNKVKRRGFLRFITGPMFAGKTTYLIKIIKYYKDVGKKKIIVVKPSLDSRGKNSKNKIWTHNYWFHNTFEITKNTEILKLVEQKKPEIIFFSEINFFNPEFTEVVKKIQTMGIDIVCEGLNKDYQGKYFPVVTQLMLLKPKTKTLVSNCYRCFTKATLSKRLVKKEGVILVGGKESYAPACNKCHAIAK